MFINGFSHTEDKKDSAHAVGRVGQLPCSAVRRKRLALSSTPPSCGGQGADGEVGEPAEGDRPREPRDPPQPRGGTSLLGIWMSQTANKSEQQQLRDKHKFVELSGHEFLGAGKVDGIPG